MKNQNAFTLVELAIVMTIIGLLIGGVLQGREMINNARITKVIAQAQGYSTALITFKDKYGQLPGDMKNATRRLPNCSAANNCRDGGNNRFFGGIDPSVNSLMFDLSVTNPYAAAGGWEMAQFWKHLALADLITGVDISAADGPGISKFGESHPSSFLMRGGVYVSYPVCSISGSCFEPVFGYVQRGRLYFIFTGTLTHGPYAPVGVVSPKMYATLEQKADDGNPLTGNIYALGISFGNWPNDCQFWDPVNTYNFNPKSNEPVCHIAYAAY